ncbi:hypothetical protein [Rhodoplanes sp. Z2-YC6860]|uniref:hypothetical protein n=1 Tax=Rhodoplanes sp. Z2-YC6860 TaxID=674703 RepID=UPI00082ED61E|nr:hypothetical protein [Rhodoplanes sp. Z2-YC6860]
MSILKSASALLVGAAISLGAITSVTSSASAADLLPVKAKAPVIGPTVPLDVHGYFDLTFATTRITPGGLMIYPRGGYLSQPEVGLSIDIYKDPNGFINSVSVFGGVWNEFWSSPPPGGRTWQEMDWWAGFTVGFARDWKFTAQKLDFVFPSGGSDLQNYYFILAYDDSKLGLFPFAWNPTVKLFWTHHGGSAVVLGKTSDGYRFEVGVAPSWSMQKYWGIPLTFTIPTWVAVAPSSYYNRNDGTTNLCGATQNLPCGTDNLGLVSTGLQARYSLAGVVPTRLGSWYIKAGVQYYHISNDALLASQVITGAAPNFSSAHKDVVVGNTGIGFTF